MKLPPGIMRKHIVGAIRRRGPPRGDAPAQAQALHGGYAGRSRGPGAGWRSGVLDGHSEGSFPQCEYFFYLT